MEKWESEKTRQILKELFEKYKKISKGLPAKSGVSGSLFAVAPGKLGISGFSTSIDEKGHSYRVSLAIKEFANRMNLNVFNQGKSDDAPSFS